MKESFTFESGAKMKVLIINEMIIRNNFFRGTNCFEGEPTKDQLMLLQRIHGVDHTVTDEAMQKDIDKYIDMLFEQKEDTISVREPWKEVISTDKIKTHPILGPYDRVFHIIY